MKTIPKDTETHRIQPSYSPKSNTNPMNTTISTSKQPIQKSKSRVNIRPNLLSERLHKCEKSLYMNRDFEVCFSKAQEDHEPHPDWHSPVCHEKVWTLDAEEQIDPSNATANFDLTHFDSPNGSIQSPDSGQLTNTDQIPVHTDQVSNNDPLPGPSQPPVNIEQPAYTDQPVTANPQAGTNQPIYTALQYLTGIGQPENCSVQNTDQQHRTDPDSINHEQNMVQLGQSLAYQEVTATTEHQVIVDVTDKAEIVAYLHLVDLTPDPWPVHKLTPSFEAYRGLQKYFTFKSVLQIKVYFQMREIRNIHSHSSLKP